VKRSTRLPVLAVIAVISGAVVLLGYFIELQVLVDLREMLVGWAVILSAVALLVGVLNLARVHWTKISKGQKGGVYSIVLLASLLLTVLVVGAFGPQSVASQWVFDYILVPVESSLLALLAVVLVYVGIRLLRRQLNLFTLVFLATAVLVLAGAAAFPFLQIFGLGELSGWVSQVWAAGGARGILIGVALGTIATGLRVIIGADRPYGD
jgi:hypothetical protein